jgi:hypothetical protein
MSHPLDDLLDRVHRALLAGDLAALATLGPAVEAQAENPGALDPASAATLRRKAERNARLLQATLRGVRAARARLADLTLGPTLTTYDALGRKSLLPAVPQTPARRF